MVTSTGQEVWFNWPANQEMGQRRRQLKLLYKPTSKADGEMLLGRKTTCMYFFMSLKVGVECWPEKRGGAEVTKGDNERFSSDGAWQSCPHSFNIQFNIPAMDFECKKDIVKFYYCVIKAQSGKHYKQFLSIKLAAGQGISWWPAIIGPASRPLNWYTLNNGRPKKPVKERGQAYLKATGSRTD